MIIRKTNDSFLLFPQHAHAKVSGQLAAAWGRDRSASPVSSSLLIAAEMHDCGWIDLDESPIWNETTEAPFSFLDYPQAPKLHAYTRGLNQIQVQDPYAALLCSLHYTSFFPIESDDKDVQVFLNNEADRRGTISIEVGSNPNAHGLANVERDLVWLKLLDDLSLFMCLNAPGSAPEHGIAWYKDGFRPIKLLAGEGPVRIHAAWCGTNQIQLDPFPLRSETQTSLPYWEVAVQAIQTEGWQRAWQQATARSLDVTWTSPEAPCGA
jgi:hypothetical protein